MIWANAVTQWHRCALPQSPPNNPKEDAQPDWPPNSPTGVSNSCLYRPSSSTSTSLWDTKRRRAELMQ